MTAAPTVVGAPADGDTLAVQSACIAVLNAFADRIDAGRASTVTELFTDDGSLVAGPRTMRGRDELAAGFAAREADEARRTRHLVLNPSVQVIDDGVAEARSSLMLFVLGSEPGGDEPLNPSALMNCHDRFERGADGRWRIAERQIELLAGRP